MASIGIDFGTSTTLVAIREGDTPPQVLKLGKANSWIPSVVAISAKGDLVCGEIALDQDFGRQFHSVKSAIGAGDSKLVRNGIEVQTAEIARLILRETIERSAKAGVDLTSSKHSVFVACPAGWGKEARKTLADVYSSLKVNVDVSDFIDEPIAVGFDWRYQRQKKSGELPTGQTLVFDAGGGTLDVSLIDLIDPEGGSVVSLDVDDFVILTAEMLQIAGDAIDQVIAQFIVKKRHEQLETDEVNTEILMAARRAKEALSETSTTSVSFPRRKVEPLELSREQLARFTEGIARSFELLTKRSSRGREIRLFKDASPITIRQRDWSKVADSIKYIALAGGTSQSPWVRELLQRTFPNSEVDAVASPQESVARGLTFTDRINSLNLPRPPVDLIAEITGDRGTTRMVLQEAFENVYDRTSAIAGESFLGRRHVIGNQGDTVRISAVKPNRRATPAGRFGDSFSGPVQFKFYAAGDVVIKDSSGRTYMKKVKGWPVPGGATELSFDVNDPNQIVEQWWFLPSETRWS